MTSTKDKPTAAAAPRREICGNTKCEHRAPAGCKLFEGEAWRRCRKAVVKSNNN